MSRRDKILLLALLSLLIMACSCNLGNYVNNLLKAVEETIDGSGDVPAQITPEYSQQDSEPEDVPQNVVTEEAVMVEEEVTAEEAVTGLTRPALLIQLPTRLMAGDDYGMKQTEMYSGEFIQQVSIAPNGGEVAFVTSEKEYGMGLVTLQMLDMNTGEVSVISPLTNENTTQNSMEEGDLGMAVREANMALMFDNLAWSPDGDYLAFVGAQQGEQAHVYSYNRASGEIILLMAGESHHYRPSWSPDGSYVVAPSAFGFGTGAGFSMDAVWAARPDGTDGKLLYDASGSSNETIWGWFDAHTFLVSSVDMIAGYKHLRAFDLNTESVAFEILGPSDYFSSVAVADEFGTVMFNSQISEMADYIEGETLTEDGLYFWQKNAGGYVRLNDLVNWSSNVVWDAEMRCFYAKLPKRAVDEDFIQAYTANGAIDGATCPEIVPDAEEAPIFAPSGSQYVWIANEWNTVMNPGLYWIPVGDVYPTVLAGGPIAQALWHSEEDLLYFAIEDQVYQAQGTRESVSLVSNTVGETVMSIGWVMP